MQRTIIAALAGLALGIVLGVLIAEVLNQAAVHDARERATIAEAALPPVQEKLSRLEQSLADQAAEDEKNAATEREDLNNSRPLGMPRSKIVEAIRRDYDFDTGADEKDFYGLKLKDFSIYCNIRGYADRPVVLEVNAVTEDEKTARELGVFYSLIASQLWGEAEGYQAWFEGQLPKVKTGKVFGIERGGILFSIGKMEGPAYMLSFSRVGD